MQAMSIKNRDKNYLTYIVLLLTLFFPLLMLPFNICGYLVSKNKGVFYALMIAFGISVFAFNFTPLKVGEGATIITDIMTHYTNMLQVKEMSLADGLKDSAYSINYGYFLFLKLFGIFDSIELFSMTFTCIGYFVLLFLIVKQEESYSFENRVLRLLLSICLIQFLLFASGVRQANVFVLFALILYFETKANNKAVKVLCWICYILLFLMHTSAAILWLIRIVAYLFEFLIRKNKKNAFFLLLLLPVCFLLQSPLCSLLKALFPSNDLILKIVKEIEKYKNGATDLIKPMFLYETAVHIFLCFALFFARKKLYEKNSKFFVLCLVVAFFTTGTLLYWDFFSRFIVLEMILVIPILGVFFDMLNGKLKLPFELLLGILCIFVLVYNIDQCLLFKFNGFTAMLSTNIVKYIITML